MSAFPRYLSRSAFGLVLVASLAVSSFASGQVSSQGAPPVPPQRGARGGGIGSAFGMDKQIAMAVEESMGNHVESSAHLTLTPLRAATPADSARAAKVAVDLRRGIEKYKDVSLAVADGFEVFAPQAEQPVYHYVHPIKMLREQSRFDAADPSTLIYQKNAKGELELIGAMYMAAPRSTSEELDARVPTGVARWHRHVNYCFPTDRRRMTETRDGKPLFGPVGLISTAAECTAASGRFSAELFGWMVHANVFGATDAASIWGGGHKH